MYGYSYIVSDYDFVTFVGNVINDIDLTANGAFLIDPYLDHRNYQCPNR